MVGTYSTVYEGERESGRGTQGADSVHITLLSPIECELAKLASDLLLLFLSILGISDKQQAQEHSICHPATTSSDRNDALNVSR